MTKYAATTNMIGVTIMPTRSARAGFEEERLRTMAMPMIEQMRPVDASASGRNMSAARASASAKPVVKPSRTTAPRVAAMAMDAIMAPQ